MQVEIFLYLVLFLSSSDKSGTWAVVCPLIHFSKSLVFCLGSDPRVHSSKMSPGVHRQLYGFSSNVPTFSMISMVFLVSWNPLFNFLIKLDFSSPFLRLAPLGLSSKTTERNKKATGIHLTLLGPQLLQSEKKCSPLCFRYWGFQLLLFSLPLPLP